MTYLLKELRKGTWDTGILGQYLYFITTCYRILPMCLSYTGQIIQWAFWAQKAAREIYVLVFLVPKVFAYLYFRVIPFTDGVKGLRRE